MKTGNTGDARTTADLHQASMEPGHEDREYRQDRNEAEHDNEASMEPGHEDREYRPDCIAQTA